MRYPLLVMHNKAHGGTSLTELAAILVFLLIAVAVGMTTLGGQLSTFFTTLGQIFANL